MKILLVEDLDDDRKALSHVLEQAGHKVVSKANAEDASSQAESTILSFDVAILDWQLPRQNGLELGQTLFYQNPRLFLIMLTAYGTVEKKMEATRYGGFIHFISKPGSSEVLETLTVLEQQVQQRRDLFKKINDAGYGIVGSSPGMTRLRQFITTVAPTDASVLILGESGTGKELVAAALHSTSERSIQSYVRINCAAIPETLLETELFGHEKGAFTGAVKQKRGRFEEADGGTVFLDEIADMSRPLQAKLLRFLEDGTFTRVGGTQELRVDVRLIAATNRDIKEAIKKNEFRADLFYRISVVELLLPPLRERGEDVLLLAQTFLNVFNKKMKKNLQGFSKAAEQKLVGHNWPGNVRELRNVIHRAVIVESTNTVLPNSLVDFEPLAHSQRVPSTQEHAASTTNYPIDFDERALGELCQQIERTEGGVIQNNVEFLMKQQTPAILKAVLAIFYFHYKTNNDIKTFNKLFGCKAPHLGRGTKEIKHYLAKFSKDPAMSAVFAPRLGKKCYGVKDLIDDGKLLHDKRFALSLLIATT
jgi:two-component system, NtrC family, nitrogen regulation response regulator NtrX